MNYLQFKNGITRKIKHGGSFFGRVGTNPFIDWALVLLVGFLAACVFIAFGVYIYFQVEKGVLVTVPKKKASATLTIDRQALKNIIDAAAQKKANFEDIKKNPVGGVDPSL